MRKALGIERPEPVTKDVTLDRGSNNTKMRIMDVAQRDISKSITPDVMKTMMSEILEPFQAQITAQTDKIAEYQQLLEVQQQKMATQQETIEVYGKRFEALANTADPSTSAFTGLALRKAANPAGVVNKQAEVSEHVQGMMMRQLERTWRTSENPAEREAAYSALNKMKNTFE